MYVSLYVRKEVFATSMLDMVTNGLNPTGPNTRTLIWRNKLKKSQSVMNQLPKTNQSQSNRSQSNPKQMQIDQQKYIFIFIINNDQVSLIIATKKSTPFHYPPQKQLCSKIHTSTFSIRQDNIQRIVDSSPKIIS